MTTDRDPNVLIAAWLDDGPLEMPAGTRRAIETAARTMPQRRSGLGRPWRFPIVNSVLRPALVVVLILVSVVGFAVYGRLRPSDSVGGPPSTSSPSAGATASIAPSPTASLTGRIAFTRSDAQVGMYGNYLGTFVGDADGSNIRKLDLPVNSDGVVWSPDGTKLLLGNSPPADGLGFRPVIVNIDASDYRRINVPGTFGDMFCSAWSPDGLRLLCGIADASDSKVAGIVSIDVATGTDMQRHSSGAYPGVVGDVSECGGGDSPGAFSPDGRMFSFVRHRCGLAPDPVQDEIASIYVGFTDNAREPGRILAAGDINSSEPRISWSPDNHWLLFASPDGRLSKVRPDGSERSSIEVDLPTGTYIYSPAWSPDGSRIIFSAWREGDTTDLWTTNADGTDARRLTNDAASEDSISWTR